jgi:hypothetical protein
MTPTSIIRGFATAAAILVGSIAIAASPVVVCGLIGEEATECCCTQKNGKLVCTYTNQVLDHCCCTIRPGPESKK